MQKIWRHQEYEEGIYEMWEKGGFFTPKPKKGRKKFCIIMPPPNANADLHIGHARFITIEDILTRYYRMKGCDVLWLPGADHAGIETQFVFEKKLKEQGKSRFDFNREELYKMIWNYVQENRSKMEKQIRSLGASCDWTRQKFTLDPKIVKIVYKTFKKMYDDKLVYRGKRIVNYCPRCGTTYSQLETEPAEKEDILYYLDYKTIVIATTRPETIFADVAVAVNPKDKRYQKIIGKNATIPIINKEIPIIADNLVDIKFGTGALKITPGHDATDFEIGKKHNLETILVIDKQGNMINTPQKYLGLKANIAREKVVEDLEKKSFVVKKEKIKHLVSVCYKHKEPIEPLPEEQWFIKAEKLAKEALLAIKEKRIKFASKKYERVAVNWLVNLKDWNVSRQIVWGIRIPAWFCKRCENWTVTEGENPKFCQSCKNKEIEQDKDTFDTWFSSGQWPYATLACDQSEKIKIPITPKMKSKISDLKNFYPTSVMETGFDIIPFWVIRMIMLGLYATNEVPFKEVLIHGLVRDKNGQKISKSKGNVINPIDMASKYGTDALRNAMVWGTKIENDISLSEDNIRGQRNFANKIWNIARFIKLTSEIQNWKEESIKPKTKDDLRILNKMKKTITEATLQIERYRFNEAIKKIYNFVWHDLADQYIESIKTRTEEGTKIRNDSIRILQKVFKTCLVLLHPFMPYITEAIWKELRISKKPLITEKWPTTR